MKTLKSAALGLAVLAMATSAFAQSDPAVSQGAMPSSHGKIMKSCMAMSSDDMMRNKGCIRMMHKMNMSEMELNKMKSCKAMPIDDMTKDTDCSTMMKMHPGMMDRDMGVGMKKD